MNEIEVIWKFLDNLDEYVYATDIETDELVYMNRKLLEVYGLQSIDDVKGMKCYEVLQKSSVPCGMCNNDRLCAGKFVEWRYYNPVIDKYMMLKDTLVEDPVTNKKYRIEISIDISEERSQDKMIQKYRDMESFVNEALKDALSVESPDETIRIILEYLGKVLNGERTTWFVHLVVRTFTKSLIHTCTFLCDQILCLFDIGSIGKHCFPGNNCKRVDRPWILSCVDCLDEIPIPGDGIAKAESRCCEKLRGSAQNDNVIVIVCQRYGIDLFHVFCKFHIRFIDHDINIVFFAGI